MERKSSPWSVWSVGKKITASPSISPSASASVSASASTSVSPSSSGSPSPSPAPEPSPQEIMELTAIKIEKLRKKGKTEEEIEVIIKDYVEDLVQGDLW